MALSNMFNEPRREITETVVGLAVFVPVSAALVYVDYLFANWFYAFCGSTHDNMPWGLAMILGPVIVIILIVVGYGSLAIIHAIGDGVCDWLDMRGMRLRPERERRVYSIPLYLRPMAANTPPPENTFTVGNTIFTLDGNGGGGAAGEQGKT